MTLDADHYRINIPAIYSFLKEKDEDERYEYISKLAIITGVPICIVVVYVIELFGNSLKLTEKLQQLKSFYHVDDIVNTKVNINVDNKV
jgi:hypothetical protein